MKWEGWQQKAGGTARLDWGRSEGAKFGSEQPSPPANGWCCRRDKDKKNKRQRSGQRTQTLWGDAGARRRVTLICADGGEAKRRKTGTDYSQIQSVHRLSSIQHGDTKT